MKEKESKGRKERTRVRAETRQAANPALKHSGVRRTVLRADDRDVRLDQGLRTYGLDECASIAARVERRRPKSGVVRGLRR